MPATYQKIKVTEDLLNSEPNSYFVYGDNMNRQGLDGAASMRNHPRCIGFVTRKPPEVKPSANFKVEEYAKTFFQQLTQLADIVKKAPHQKFYISKVGSGAANKYYIWERIIRSNLIIELGEYDNVVFCWEE